MAVVIGGLYGIIHDQLTYTVSPEYYTKFKFYQFGLAEEGNEAHLPHPRLAAARVGIMATWWMGAFIGFVLGLVGLWHATWRAMLRHTLMAFLLTVGTALLTGLVGLAYGWLVLGNQERAAFTAWFIPENVLAFRNYVAVGSMHNFSYLGGLLGLLSGVIYTLKRRRATPASYSAQRRR